MFAENHSASAFDMSVIEAFLSGESRVIIVGLDHDFGDVVVPRGEAPCHVIEFWFRNPIIGCLLCFGICKVSEKATTMSLYR